MYAGTTGPFWRRRTFEESLYRCAEGHVYSVRTEAGIVSSEAHESIEAWLERKTGVQPPQRPPGL